MTLIEAMKYVGKESADAPWPPYAWPGGYTILYMADDGEFLCSHCMDIEPVHFGGDADGWRIDAITHSGAEDLDDIYCSHCARELIAPEEGAS